MNYIFDTVLVAIIIVAIVIGRKKGFLKSSYNVLSLLISTTLILTLSDPFCEYLKNSTFGELVHKRVEEKIIVKTDDEDTDNEEIAEKIGEIMNLPDFLVMFLEERLERQTEAIETAKNDVINMMVDTVTDMIIKIVSIILLFLLVRIGVFLLLKILGVATKMPGINGIDRFFGTLIGAVNGVFIVYIICAIITLFVSGEKFEYISSVIDSTYVVKYFYNNNFLIELFM